MIFGAIGGMKIGRGNRSTRRKPTPRLQYILTLISLLLEMQIDTKLYVRVHYSAAQHGESQIEENGAIRAGGQALIHCCKVYNFAKFRRQNENKYGVKILNKISYIKTPWFQSAKRTIPTERPPLVGEVSANFSG
jgi:hypothetical protein